MELLSTSREIKLLKFEEYIFKIFILKVKLIYRMLNLSKINNVWGIHFDIKMKSLLKIYINFLYIKFTIYPK